MKLLLLSLAIALVSMFCLALVPPTTKPKVHTVTIYQMQFNPAKLTVHKGDSVIFINKDVVAHNVTEISGKSWKSPTLTSGDSWKMVVVKSSEYYCSFHPVMKGKILVE